MELQKNVQTGVYSNLLTTVSTNPSIHRLSLASLNRWQETLELVCGPALVIKHQYRLGNFGSNRELVTTSNKPDRKNDA